MERTIEISENRGRKHIEISLARMEEAAMMLRDKLARYDAAGTLREKADILQSLGELHREFVVNPDAVLDIASEIRSADC